MWDDWLEDNQSIDYYKFNNRTGTLSVTFHKPVGGENPYVWFGYIPHTISITPKDKFQGWINYDKVNAIYTSQQ